MSEFEIIRLVVLGIVAGFIDAIAGGGGLITIPSLALVMGLNSTTIGTNKLAAVLSTLVALLVYMKKGHFNFKKGIYFATFIGVGSFLGSQATGFVTGEVYKYFLIATAPIILWLIFNKKLWLSQAVTFDEDQNGNKQKMLLALCGLAVGFYDGLWGPGGGTFMLLALLFISKLPLLSAIAISKFANFASASSSLMGFVITGKVVWEIGLLFMLPVGLGAFLGAQLVSQKAEKIVRPILVVVVMLLLLKVFMES